MERLTGRTVIVTGAASGIGQATARRLLSEGANVLAADLSVDTVGAALEDVDAERLVAYGIDVSDPAQAIGLVDAAEQRFGKLHGLVNCAGVRGVGNVLDITPEELDRVLAVNLAGTLYTCQAFARAVTGVRDSRGASIVNVSSAAGIRAVPNRLAYVASKFGVVGISQAMALELGPAGVRVNVVCPGMIRTPMTSPMFADPDNVERIRAAHPIGREGEPEEIAATNAFLISDDASYLTGAVLAVDGGNTAGVPSFGGREQEAQAGTTTTRDN